MSCFLFVASNYHSGKLVIFSHKSTEVLQPVPQNTGSSGTSALLFQCLNTPETPRAPAQEAIYKLCDKFSGTSASSKPLNITPVYGILVKMYLMLLLNKMNQSGGKRPVGFKEPPRPGLVTDSTRAEPSLTEIS